MSKRILVIQGHPDKNPARLCSALLAAYTQGAQAAGHLVRQLILAIGFSAAAQRMNGKTGPTPKGLIQTQEDIFGAAFGAIFPSGWGYARLVKRF